MTRDRLHRVRLILLAESVERFDDISTAFVVIIKTTP